MGGTGEELSALLDRIAEAYGKEEWAAALALCDDGLENHSVDHDLLYYKGLCHLALGASPEAIVAFERSAANGHLDSHFQLGMMAIRQGVRRARQRTEVIDHFEAILQAVATGREFAELDRVYFALGGQYGAEPERVQEAIKMFRQGLALNPLSAVGHNGLGQYLLQSGQVLGAMGEFKVAIQLDPGLNPAYANLAKLFMRHVKPADLEQEYRHIADEFEESAPQVLSRLSLEMVELGKEQVYEGFYTKGHRIKNLMGIFGSRLRGLGRKAEGDLQEQLTRLGGEHEGLYDEWVSFLDAMKVEKIRPVVVEPARLARRVVELVRSQPWKSEVQLRVQEGMPRIEVDERMLREAVVNLCLNALEILEEEQGGRVVLGVGYDEERSLVFLEVEDDGPGIEEAHLDLVFEPGFTTRERGNGYGLSIARRIAQAHHGALRVKSRKGHGTVFRLDLPLNFAASDN